MSDTVSPAYPWQKGDELFHDALNAAIGTAINLANSADATAGSAHTIANAATTAANDAQDAAVAAQAAADAVATTASAAQTSANAAQTAAAAAMPKVGGTIVATGSTASRTNEDRAADTLTTKDFGAVGDGVADDTVPLRTAFNSGVPVRMTVGKYRTTSPITTAANQIIIADNVNSYDDPATIPGSVPVVSIVADNSGGGFAPGSAVLTLADRASIRDFQITSVAGVDAVSSSGRFVTLERIYTRLGRHGAYLNQVGPRVLFCRFSEASDHGLLSDTSCTDATIVGTFFAANGGCGMQGLFSIKHTLVGCTFEWNSSHGLNFFDSNTCMITGCSFDRNSASGLRVGASSNMSFVGNTFRRNGVTDASFPCHISFQAGGLFGLQFCGNTYLATKANDDLTGPTVPNYTYRLESTATLTASMFAERPENGAIGLCSDTATSDAVHPQMAISAENTPGPYANDSAAQGAGVGIGSVYKDTAGILRLRVT